MNRAAMIFGREAREEPILETDIMRFMAIIGIVLWIIFALVKTIPFRHEETALNDLDHEPVLLQAGQAEHPDQTYAPAPHQAVLPRSEQAVDHEHKDNPQPVRKAQRPLQADKAEKNEPEMPASPALDNTPRGIWIEFASREDMLHLLKNRMIRLFARAKNQGFDLVYEAGLVSERVVFSSVRDMPGALWIIPEGPDRDYFIKWLTRENPSLDAFEKQEILVSFTDHDLDSRLEQDLASMRGEGLAGVLSINRQGGHEFIPHGQDR